MDAGSTRNHASQIVERIDDVPDEVRLRACARFRALARRPLAIVVELGGEAQILVALLGHRAIGFAGNLLVRVGVVLVGIRRLGVGWSGPAARLHVIGHAIALRCRARRDLVVPLHLLACRLVGARSYVIAHS